MIDEKIIYNILSKITDKISVLADDFILADVGRDGFLAKEEANAMITGFLGGKGSLQDTNLDNATRGGIYLLTPDKSYLGTPFANATSYTTNLPANLIVIRNYGANPRTTNPAITQVYVPLSSQSVYWSFRSYINGKWSKWIYPNGLVLWRGNAAIEGSTIDLIDPLTDFAKVAIEWAPPSRIARVDEFQVTSDGVYQLNTLNASDDSSHPGADFFECQLKPQSDNRQLVGSEKNYTLTTSGITYNSSLTGARLISVKGLSTI